MGRGEEKQAFTSTYSPIREHEKESNLEFEEESASSSRCCLCFQFRGWKLSRNQESKSLLQENNNNGHGLYYKDSSWFVNKLKELKEFSEVVAGPKWKNFVRKIGKYFKPKNSRTQNTMYSPHSYALNFDDGEDVEEEDDEMFVSFSSRFSAPLSSTNQKRMPGIITS